MSLTRTLAKPRIPLVLLRLILFCSLALILSSQAASPRVGAQIPQVIGDSQINQCETKTYTIALLNNSGNPLTDVVVTNNIDSLPGFSYVSGTTSIDVNGGAAFLTADPTIASGPRRLIWDIDALSGGPFTLNNGETLNITFALETDCDAASGSMNVRFDYEISGTPMFDETATFAINVLPGGVTIKMTPNVIPQEIGQMVTWTLAVENAGQGLVENVKVTDALGDGLSYVSSNPAGINTGQNTTWDASQVAAFASMNPGEIVTIDITAMVLACGNLDNIADASWGCDPEVDCYNTAVDGGTATASVQRISKTPLIDYTPPDISFDYCGDSVDVNFTITNIGDGQAHDVWVLADFGPMTVSDVSAGATYNSTEKRFELTDPLSPGAHYDLSFRLSYAGWCGGSFPAGHLPWQAVYEDDCGEKFYSGAKLSTVNTPAGSTALLADLSGAPGSVQIGGQISYAVQSSYSGSLSCGAGGSVGVITVVDTLPQGFIVLDAGGGTWVPGAGGTGGAITWTYMPPASLNTTIVLQVPDRTQCATYCLTTAINSVAATGVDCCGCTLNASDSQSTVIECANYALAYKTVTPSTAERCSDVEYTNTYDFGSAINTSLNSLVFEEQAANQQQYVPGSLTVTYHGSDVTTCVLVTDNTPGGSLHLDFSGCAADALADKVLIISYDLTVTEATAAACDSASFESWSSLDVGSECPIYSAAAVTVDRPEMSLSITGLGEIVHRGETQTITLDLTQTSVAANPRDVRLVLSGLNYYVVKPAAATCNGVAPTSCIPTVVGDDYVWYFADGFTGSGQTATITLEVQKRCTGGGDLTAIVYYDDHCNDDGVYDDTCSTTVTETPALLLSGDLLIEKTPEVYHATTNSVQWRIYLTNRGAGTAYNVWVDDVLGAGLDYASAVVDNMTGVTVTADQSHDGGAINGATISISEMAAGQRREITLTALLIDCDNLTNDVSASWGAAGSNCQTAVTDSSSVDFPASLLIQSQTATTPIAPCSSPNATITLRNAGQVAVYNLQVTDTLPPGLLYVSGATRWRVNHGAWNGPNVAYDPNPTVSPLRWTSTEIPALASLSPGDAVEIEIQMQTDCPFAGGDLVLSTQYESPCGSVVTAADSRFAVAVQEPIINISKTRANEPIDCGELLEWTITVENRSGYTLPIIWVEDTLGAAYTFASSVGDPPFTSDDGTPNGQTVSWELRNVAHGDVVHLTLRATVDSSPCSPDLDNTVKAWWGCGDADGSSATKPGQDAPDNVLCLTTADVSTTRTETREPSIGFLDISLSPPMLNSCDDVTELTVNIENTGPTDASNVDLVVALPDGLSYVAGSSAVACGGGLPSTAADPAVLGNQLIYYNVNDKGNNLCNLVEAAGGNDTVTLVFSVRSNGYATANLGFALYYYDCCGDTQYSTSTSETLAASYPNLSVTQSPFNSQIACGSQQIWAITVTNNGTGEAEVVRIEDTPGDWIDVNIGASSAGLTDMGGGVYGWEINNLAAGGSQEFTLVGTLNPDGLPNQADCTAALRQNSVRAWWGCGTTGDAIDNNPTTQSYDTYDTPANAPAATLQMPDLVVDAINPTISCTSDGSFSGTISAQVRNQGSGSSTGAFTVQVTDGKGWTGTGAYTGTIAPGGSVDVAIDTTTWSPACYPCADSYSFNATVDLNGDVCECNEANNTSVLAPYTSDIPDVEVKSDALTVSAAADGQVTVSGTITLVNNGCGSNLTSNVPLRFTLYDNTGGVGNLVAQWTETLSGVNIVAGGGTQTFTIVSQNVTSNLCTNSVGCQVSIRIDTDYGDAICECDGTNNIYVADNKNVDIPDLMVQSDTLALSVVDGEASVSGSVTLMNMGCGSNLTSDVPMRFTLYDSVGSIVAQWTQTFSSVNIQAGGGTQVFTVAPQNVAGNFCTNSTNCQVSMRIEADYSDNIAECDGTNNTRTETYTSTLPDLRVNSVTPSITCVGDSNLQRTVTVNVSNFGCGDANGVVVQLTSDCGLVFADQTINLTAGASSDLTFNFTPDCAECTCTFAAVIDPDNIIPECNEANNTPVLAPYASDIPDVEVKSDALTVSAAADGQVTVSGTITLVNNGCGSNLTSNVPLRFTLYDNTGGAGNLVAQWTETLSGVNIAAGGGTQTFTIVSQNVTSNLCTNSIGCQVSIRIDTDYGDAICECDGTNNIYVADNKNVDIPDLMVQSDTLALSAVADGEASVSGSVTLMNMGCGSNLTSDVPMRFTLYDSVGSIVAQWTQTFSSVNIQAGGGTQVFTVAPQNVAGNFCTNSTNCQVSMRIEADYSDNIAECDGTNNTRTETYTSTLPDLRVNSVTPSITCVGDGNLQGTVTVNVSNFGCGDANGVVVRLTSDCGLTFADQTINLTAGASSDLTFNFTPDCAECTCTFTAVIDPDNIIPECDEANNTLVSAPHTSNVPDVEVQSDALTLSATATDGQVTVSGTITLVNNGCGSNLTSNVPVRFTLYDNTGGVGNLVAQWTETLSGVNIAAGGGTQAFTITPQNITSNLCANSTGCQVSVRIEADYADTICECDGTDNIYVADNKNVDIPDLMVQSDTLTLSAAADGQVTVSGTITLVNNGCGSNLTSNVPLRFTLYDNTGGVGNLVAQWTETLSGVNIAAGGGTQTFTIVSQNVTSNLCTNSTNCQVSILVEADYGDAICECDGTDNIYVADNKNVDIPDLTVQSDTLALSAVADGEASVSGSVTLMNMGCGSNLTSDVPMRFTLYDNTGGTGNLIAQWTETLSGVNIAAGGGTQAFTITPQNITSNLCANSAHCQVSIRIEVDYSNTIAECDGTNNESCNNETVPIPNLRANGAANGISCASDGNITSTSVNVSNEGCAAANGVVIRLTSDCGLVFADQTVDLNAGEARDVSFPFTSGLTTCSCNFSATIDPDGAVFECDGTDNTVSSTSPLMIPDIVVYSDTLSVGNDFQSPVIVSGTVTIVNNGCGPNLTADIPMSFTLCAEPGCSAGSFTQWAQTFSGVDIPSGGGTQTFTIVPVEFPGQLCDGPIDCLVSIGIDADYSQTICEWDGSNNTRCADDKPVDMPPGYFLPSIWREYVYAPDLVIDEVIASANLVTVKIRNRGTQDTYADFWMDVYFDPDRKPRINEPWPTLAAHGIAFGVTDLVPAGGTLVVNTAGEYFDADQSSPPPWPVGVPVWTYVDSVDFTTTWGAVRESDEGNNAFGPVTSVSAAGQAAVGRNSPSATGQGLPSRR